MLESMRKHTEGWIAKVILGGIILSFALWGVGDYFTGNQVETAAEIDGEAIYDVEFAETYRRQLARYSQMLGDQFSKELADQLGVKNETIQTMINRHLMLKEAQTLGLVVPNQAVLGTLQSNPAFRVDKSFSNARYQSLVAQMGFASPRDYENFLRQSIMIDTLQKGISDAVSVSEEEVLHRFKTKFEKRVLASLVVNPDSLKKAIKVDDAQARDWYEAHANQYQSPLKVEVQLVEISGKDLLKEIEVSAQDIERAYEERQAEFGTPEKRKASHILVRVAKDASEDVLKVAQEKIAAAQQRLAKGESFADVAKDVSDDVTASSGGDLGFFAKGAMVPEFESAVFSAAKVGDVSDVVRTQFGLHLIKLDAIEEAKVQPLAEVREQIVSKLKMEAANNEAYRLSEDLDNALGMEDSLKAAADSVNLPLRELGKLSSKNVLADPLLGTSPELQKKVFSMQPGDAVEIQEISNGEFVAIEVLNRFNPETLPYEEVVSQVYDDVKSDLAAKRARELANEILVAAQAGANIDDLAQKYGQPKYVSKPVLSSGEGDDAPWVKDVLQASFRSPESTWLDAPLPTSQGMAVVLIQEVQAADEAKFADEKDTVRDEAIKAKGAVRFARWMASVRERHDININQRVIDRF